MTRQLHDLTGLGAHLLSQASIHVVRLAQHAVGDAYGLWREHQRRMDTHGVYRAVVTSGTGFLGRRLDLEGVALAVVSALIRHRTRSTRSGFDNDWDDYPNVEHWPT